MTRFLSISGLGRAFPLGLLRCEKAATIAEYGIIAALVLTAWGAVDSPRFQTVKDDNARRPLCMTAKRGTTPSWDKDAFAHAPRCTPKVASKA